MPANSQAKIEVTRGRHVESTHSASLVLCNGDGEVLLEMGDGERPVFPRSAIKSFQALALVESGAADKYGFVPAQIALACSSHNGEDIHTEAAKNMLLKAHLSCDDLECGCHNPMFIPATEALFQLGMKPGPEHNNCSGKHAGFLAFAKQCGMKTKGYIQPDHQVQEAIADLLQALTGSDHNEGNRAIDGCSIPTYAIPLKNIAAGAARFASQNKLSNTRGNAARRILAACSDHPEMVAGTDRACTRIMQVTGRRASVKVGAEGVYVGMFPDLGLGVALKVHDGQARAAECLIAEITRQLLRPDDRDDATLEEVASPTLKNHNGFDVGSIALSKDTRKVIDSISV